MNERLRGQIAAVFGALNLAVLNNLSGCQCAERLALDPTRQAVAEVGGDD